MPPDDSHPVRLADLLEILLRRRLAWILPTVLLTAAAAGYALLRPAVWEACQAMLVRDEALGGLSRPGRFDNAEEMKTAQETVLELARSPSVVAAALTEVGPAAARRRSGAWPARKDVERMQERIQVAAPRGEEFGRTEVFYLKVQAETPERAVALTRALARQLDSRMRQLRDRKAQSLIDELAVAADLAHADLDRSTRRLVEMEQQAGKDLPELRILSESASGESNLRGTLIQLQNEQRQAEEAQRTSQQLLDILEAAQQDPQKLVATPNQLLDALPALRQLKDGLVAAQLQTASLLGEMSEAHPKVKAALATEQHIRRQLHDELATAVRSLEAERELHAQRVASVDRQLRDVSERMKRLAASRASYSNVVEEVRRRRETLKQAEHELAAARASQAAARSASLITQLDGPQVGDEPAGPSKAALLLMGLLGGLAAGAGVLFLTAPTAAPATADSPGRRRPPAAASEADAPSRPSTIQRGLSLREALSRIAESSPSRN